ncbi:MAG TPA: hypothetical protein VFJ22_17105 [Dermatophilaceae bacterium]|nr:hypothetical protein [Dermatophilaceae bacterium]
MDILEHRWQPREELRCGLPWAAGDNEQRIGLVLGGNRGHDGDAQPDLAPTGMRSILRNLQRAA